MVRIGTWKKIRQIKNDLYEYENSDRVSLKVFRFPEQHIGYDSEGKGGYILPASRYWSVSVLRPRRLYTYLAGGNSRIHNASKKRAFDIAREFMRKNP